MGTMTMVVIVVGDVMILVDVPVHAVEHVVVCVTIDV